MGKKKILFIMTSLGGGGAEKVLLTMLKNFDYTQFDVSLCVISNTGAYLNEVPSQVHLVPIYQSPNSLLARIGFNLYSKLRCTWVERFSARRSIKEHYDTIISFCEGRSVKFHGYLMDRAKRNISWVHCDLFTMHYTVGPVLSAKDEKRLYEAMDEVVFVSKESREQFKKLGYALKKSSVVYNPIDREYIQSFQKVQGNTLVGGGKYCPLRASDETKGF